MTFKNWLKIKEVGTSAAMAGPPVPTKLFGGRNSLVRRVFDVSKGLAGSIHNMPINGKENERK
jgi:hypothetical protein